MNADKRRSMAHMLHSDQATKPGDQGHGRLLNQENLSKKPRSYGLVYKEHEADKIRVSLNSSITDGQLKGA